eukprot:9809600-Ditylum_brightwellii.AAC.2
MGHYVSNCNATIAEGDETNNESTVAFVISEISIGSNTYSFTFSRHTLEYQGHRSYLTQDQQPTFSVTQCY